MVMNNQYIACNKELQLLLASPPKQLCKQDVRKLLSAPYRHFYMGTSNVTWLVL